MKIFLTITAFALGVTLFSCKDEYQLIGKWDDQIKLSAKSATLQAETDSVFFTTKGTGWWFNGIESADSTYFGIDENLDNIYSFHEEFFIVEKRENGLFVKFHKNESKKERSISIVLQAGNYFDYVEVKQGVE